MGRTHMRMILAAASTMLAGGMTLELPPPGSKTAKGPVYPPLQKSKRDGHKYNPKAPNTKPRALRRMQGR